jgi:hypothetical protein
VTGYRRLTACKALEWPEIPCLDISSASLSALELLLLSFHDNLATRELNPIEKGMFIKRASCFFSKDKIIQDYMPLLGLPCHDSVLQIFLRMDEWTETQCRGIMDKKVSLQTMTALMEMDIASRSSIFNWIIELNLNFNQQLQFIEFINDISIQLNSNNARFLEEADFFDTLKDTKMNKPQKAKVILEKLRLMRYPRLVRVEKEFQQQIHKLNLPKFARILHSPGFEDVHCHLTIDFKNGWELKQRMLALSQLEHLEKLNVF